MNEEMGELLDLLEEVWRTGRTGPWYERTDALLRRYGRRPPSTPAEPEKDAQEASSSQERGFQADLEVVQSVDRATTYKNVHRRVRANAQEGLPPPDAVLDYIRGRTGPLGGEG